MLGDSNLRYVVEKVKDEWVCFSLVENHGKTFKNWVGAAPSKLQAEAIKAKAEAVS